MTQTIAKVRSCPPWFLVLTLTLIACTKNLQWFLFSQKIAKWEILTGTDDFDVDIILESGSVLCGCWKHHLTNCTSRPDVVMSNDSFSVHALI